MILEHSVLGGGVVGWGEGDLDPPGIIEEAGDVAGGGGRVVTNVS